MGREHGVNRRPQWMVLRQRFSVVDVERRDDLAALNGGEESGFVDERASRRINQDRALFHAGDVLGADEATRVWRQAMCTEMTSAPRMRSDLLTRTAPASSALAAVRFGLQAMTFISSASAERARRAPRRPRPTIPRVLSARPTPTGTPDWKPPARMAMSPAGIARAAAVIRP